MTAEDSKINTGRMIVSWCSILRSMIKDQLTPVAARRELRFESMAIDGTFRTRSDAVLPFSCRVAGEAESKHVASFSFASRHIETCNKTGSVCGRASRVYVVKLAS